MAKSGRSEARLWGRITASAWCCSGNMKARTGGCVSHLTLLLTMLTVYDLAPNFLNDCQSALRILPFQRRYLGTDLSRRRMTLGQTVFGMCFLICGETQMYCIQFLQMLRGKYQGEQSFTWQETPDVGQKIFPSLRRLWFYFSMAFLTGMWALPLWWAMQPLLRASDKAIRIFSWILPQRKKSNIKSKINL